MAVDAGAAVAREVLGAGGHARRLQPGDRGGGVPRHEAGVGAERPGADDRVVGGGVDVDRRRQVQIDAEGGQVGAERAVDGSGQGEVVDRAQRGVARVRAARQVRDPGDVAAFLVDRDDRLVGCRPAAQRSARPAARRRRCSGRRRLPPPARRPARRSTQAGAWRPGNGGISSASASRPMQGSAEVPALASDVIPSPPRPPARRPAGAGRSGRRSSPGSCTAWRRP